LTFDEITDLFKANKLTDADYDDIRLNLMKSQLGNHRDVLFGSLLPDIETRSNIWYTQLDNNLGVIRSPPSDFLRQLYMAVYTDTTPGDDSIRVPFSTGAGFNNLITLRPIQKILSRRNFDEFNLDYGKFMAACIRTEDEMLEEAKQRNKQPITNDLDYPFLKSYGCDHDIVYGKLWSYDASQGQYYRFDKNKKRIWYNDELKRDPQTCYASYLSKGNLTGCHRVIQCIADGNDASLHRCLDVLEESNLWDVAEDDVKKVSPDMIKLVLRKFRIGAIEVRVNGDVYLEPISYERWESKILNKEIPETVRNVILKNKKLLNYLRALIGICKANPNILNRSNKTLIARNTTPTFFGNLGMRNYQDPSIRTSGKSRLVQLGQQLYNQPEPLPIGPNMLGPIVNNLYSNTSFVNQYSTPDIMGMGLPMGMPGMGMPGMGMPGMGMPGIGIPGLGPGVMVGGSHGIMSGTSGFNHTIKMLNNVFSEAGLEIHPDDQTKLSAVSKQIESYEKQLTRLIEILNVITKTARFYGISLDSINGSNPRAVKLSELDSVEKAKEFLKYYAKDLSKSILTNVNIQQSANHMLLSKMIPRLLGYVDCNDSSQPSSEPMMVDI
jgi:hypothetical protein